MIWFAVHFTEEMSGVFAEVASYTLKLHTDSIEFSPCGKQVLVGSYELNEVNFSELIILSWSTEAVFDILCILFHSCNF